MSKIARFRYLLGALFLLIAAVVCATSIAAPDPIPFQNPQSAIQDCEDVFIDVCPGAWFYEPVMSLHQLGAVSGYSDGTFRPGNLISRGQVMKIIVLAFGLDGYLPEEHTFADVPPAAPSTLSSRSGMPTSWRRATHAGGLSLATRATALTSAPAVT